MAKRRARRPLAGRFGIPAENALEVLIRVFWEDGRSWRIDRIGGADEYGSIAAGELVVRWRVLISGSPKHLYMETDGTYENWFVRRK